MERELKPWRKYRVCAKWPGAVEQRCARGETELEDVMAAQAKYLGYIRKDADPAKTRVAVPARLCRVCRVACLKSFNRRENHFRITPAEIER